jgi:hypothetical protein
VSSSTIDIGLVSSIADPQRFINAINFDNRRPRNGWARDAAPTRDH